MSSFGYLPGGLSSCQRVDIWCVDRFVILATAVSKHDYSAPAVEDPEEKARKIHEARARLPIQENCHTNRRTPAKEGRRGEGAKSGDGHKQQVRGVSQNKNPQPTGIGHVDDGARSPWPKNQYCLGLSTQN